MILDFIKDLFKEISKGDPLAIGVVVLIILLFFSRTGKSLLKSENKEFSEKLLKYEEQFKALEIENSKIKNQLLDNNDNIKHLNIQIKNQEEELKSSKNQESFFKKKITDLKSSVTKINEKYTKSYAELINSKQQNKENDVQLKTYRLSPHMLKNFLNRAFLETKSSFEETEIKENFSVMGKKYYCLSKLEEITSIKNKDINSNLKLLIDTLDYLIYSNTNSSVHLETELTHIEKFCNLIEIHKGIKIEITKNIIVDNISILPTILFNYIDNAIKHGYFKERALKINLYCDNKSLRYIVQTPLHPSIDNTQKLGGVGNKDFEENIYAYYDNAKVTNEIMDNTYIARLNLEL